MAEEDESPVASTSSLSSPLKLSSGSNRPTITLPPRTTMDSLFAGGMGFSPGPMTLVSNFFSETDPDSEYRSFSQLLAGAMTSPAAVASSAATADSAQKVSFPSREEVEEEVRSGDGGGGSGDFGFRFQQNRPTGLVTGQSSMLTIPAGLSPASLLDSPVLFSSTQGGFGMSHQQALVQVTAQAAQTHSQIHPQPPQEDYRSTLPTQHAVSFTQPMSLTANATTHQQMSRLESVPTVTMNESSEFSNSDQRSYYSTIIADKPANDDYNWRKYGQKHVKGSEFPRSYYKCTHPNCPVTKKVERSLEGHVTEIIYKGQHNHQPPQSNKRTKGTGQSNGSTVAQGHPELASQVHNNNVNKLKGVTACSSKDQEYTQNTSDHTGSSDNEEGGDAERMGYREEDEPDPKRRSSEFKAPEPVSTHKTVTEPRIIVQTTSEVDLLDDGYRWRKYGQKVVKGNPYPRSYYKCTTPACNVRKHVERAATDPKAVITTYEGKHNHDVPASRNSSHNTSNSNSSHGTMATEKKTNLGNNDQRPIAVLRLKEEQLT